MNSLIKPAAGVGRSIAAHALSRWNVWFASAQNVQVDVHYRYAGSLQLLDAENDDGDRSLPQIQSPALLGLFRKCSFRDAKYLSIASLASSIEA